MKKRFCDFKNLDFSDCREITGDELCKINGGERVENSNEAVAQAQVGDTIERDDGSVVTLNQGDINWAQEHCNSNNNNPTDVSDLQTAQTTPEPVNTNPTNSIDNPSVESEPVYTNQFTSFSNEIHEIDNNNLILNSDTINSQSVAKQGTEKRKGIVNILKSLFLNDNSTSIYTFGISGSATVAVVSKAGGAGLYINPKNEALHSLSNIMIKQNNIVARVVGIALLTSNIDDFGAYCGIEGGFGVSTKSASIGISVGNYTSKDSAEGAYLSYGGSAGIIGCIGYDYITDVNHKHVGNTFCLGLSFGSARLEGHARIGVTGISSFKNKCNE